MRIEEFPWFFKTGDKHPVALSSDVGGLACIYSAMEAVYGDEFMKSVGVELILLWHSLFMLNFNRVPVVGYHANPGFVGTQNRRVRDMLEANACNVAFMDPWTAISMANVNRPGHVLWHERAFWHLVYDQDSPLQYLHPSVAGFVEGDWMTGSLERCAQMVEDAKRKYNRLNFGVVVDLGHLSMGTYGKAETPQLVLPQAIGFAEQFMTQGIYTGYHLPASVRRRVLTMDDSLQVKIGDVETWKLLGAHFKNIQTRYGFRPYTCVELKPEGWGMFWPVDNSQLATVALEVMQVYRAADIVTTRLS